VTVEPNTLFTYLKWDEAQSKLVETPVTAAEAAGFKVVEDVTGSSSYWEAGTYLVEKDVTINGDIYLGGNVELIIKDGYKLTVNGKIDGNNRSYDLNVYGGKAMSGELAVNNNDDAITFIDALSIHSCKVKAYYTSSSTLSYGGVYNVSELNVYGGLFDARNPGGRGYGIALADGGSLNIYGGEVIAVGNGTSEYSSYGICVYESSGSGTVHFYGGKLYAACASNYAFKSNIGLYIPTDKTERSSDDTNWTPKDPANPLSLEKFVRIGYSTVD